MTRFKCLACGGTQYTSTDTAEGCIYCGHQELEKMDKMPKAILELPKMPESCWQCPLQEISTEKKIRYCTVIRYTTDYYGTKRREDCPLKPVESG
jgi:hypothetical protein